MPLYFFHLSSGNRTYHDGVGYEFSSRSAARAEALAAIRDLSHRGEPRRWAGWFLRVADAEGEFLCLPMGHPAVAIVPDRFQSVSRTEQKSGGRLAELVRRMRKVSQNTHHLLEEQGRLRDELASELERCMRLGLHAHALVSSSVALRRVSPGGTDFNSARAQPRRSRPHLTVLPGGR